jgi:hypothetical protein
MPQSSATAIFTINAKVGASQHHDFCFIFTIMLQKHQLVEEIYLKLGTNELPTNLPV